jgi:hypothetical protein
MNDLHGWNDLWLNVTNGQKTWLQVKHLCLSLHQFFGTFGYGAPFLRVTLFSFANLLWTLCALTFVLLREIHDIPCLSLLSAVEMWYYTCDVVEEMLHSCNPGEKQWVWDNFGWHHLSKDIVMAFYCCDKLSKQITSKKERFILAHRFRGISSWLAGSIALWPDVWQKHDSR